jgi:anti-sigma-K factor RskA
VNSSLEPKLDRLMSEYREACPEPEETAGFVPNLWSRIDARRLFDRHARRWTSAYVTAAAVICLVLVILLSLQAAKTTSSTYVDVLDENQDSSAVISGAAEPSREKQ